MKCLWCESETTSNKNLATTTVKYANEEHIFPESVGGVRTLEVGKVCQDCNGRLGNQVDQYLKTENFMMMKQYQDSSEIIGKIPGKVRNKKDRIRKEEEKKKLKGYSGGSTIERDPQNLSIITLTNMPDGSGGDFSYNDRFSKALHKCAVNVLLDSKGYDYLKKHHNELIDFVNVPTNFSYNAWSYAVCYADMFSKVHFEPFCLQQIEVDNIVRAMALIFPCAIFIVGTTPNVMGINLLELVGSNPPILKNWREQNFDYIKHYQSQFGLSRKAFGDKLKFTLVRKEIEGNPNPENSFYLLAHCNICGQTNPTGIFVAKSRILGKVNGLASGNKNSWNFHSKEDLDILAPGVQFADSIVEDFVTKYGINYPPSNSVKNMNILNGRFQCINCGEFITYHAKDCFI